MTQILPGKALLFAFIFGLGFSFSAIAGGGNTSAPGGVDSTGTGRIDSVAAYATPIPFQRVIKDPTLDFSLRNANGVPNVSAHWDTVSLNIYGVDMTLFADTLHYSLQDHSHGKKFTFPVENSWVTSGFGYRSLFGRKFHYGMDVDLETGDEVVAAMNGRVRIARYSRGYGNFIIISHEGGMETLYGHLSELWVSEGMQVKSGDLIGLGGSTGQSTGSHLHFEVRIFGEQVDPAKIINPETMTLRTDEVHIDASWFDHLGRDKSAETNEHIVLEGETLDTILEAYEITKEDITNIDEINLDEPLEPGTKLLFGQNVEHSH